MGELRIDVDESGESPDVAIQILDAGPRDTDGAVMVLVMDLNSHVGLEKPP